MQPLPVRANLEHLKKQAKDLLRRYYGGDPEAIAQFERALPFVLQRNPDVKASSRQLRLHDAQSRVARDYGFPSWLDLTNYVEAQSLARADRTGRMRRWLALIYGGDVTGSLNAARLRVAARLLDEMPDLARADPYGACAAGDEAELRRATAADLQWVNRPGGPFNLPPLVAVTHSRLAQLPEFRDRLHRSAQYLLGAGADPNEKIGNRFPPASLQTPDEGNPLSALIWCLQGSRREPVADQTPDEGNPLSALYGAAGVN